MSTPMVQMMGSTPTQSNPYYEALEIAVAAHYNQVDKGGNPYILHPIFVASCMTTVNEKIVGLLHDVLEDTKFPKDYIAKKFNKDVVDALELLTRDKNMSYEEYIDRLAKNEIARKVKIADLVSNMDVRRLNKLQNKDLVRLRKYHKAWRYLTNYGNKK